MPGPRLLLRMAPFILGVVAAKVWLRRRAAARKALTADQGLRQVESARRFERGPIDIVTVVDDLLQAGR